MKIVFHSNQLGYRGTEIALYDYALYNEEILGNDSIILIPKKAKGSSLEIVQRFMSRFNVIYYETPEEIDGILSRLQADILYCIKSGNNDGIVSKTIKTCVHAVFMEKEYHGDIYAYVSKWLSNTMSGGLKPFVPHIINIPKVDNNFRSCLGIPDNAIVFGSYGGRESFDIKFAQKAVTEIANKRPDIYFLFMNITNFYKPFIKKELPNLLFLPGTTDTYTKSAFINSCDAMLHARQRGETFGLSIGEFSALGKQIVTFSASPERAHIEILGSNAIYYNNYGQLVDILNNFQPDLSKDFDCYSSQFSPIHVMKKFKEVFIDP